MNILVDFHHNDLFFGLQLLFEKRLGHLLYRPIGEEWFNEGFWKIAEPYGNDPGTIKQYLDIGSTSKDGYPPLNEVRKESDGIYSFQDKHNESYNFGITLEAFKKIKFDIIIASIPKHIEPYKRLISQYQPNAKFIFQVGNIWWHENMNWSEIPNLMSSTAKYEVPSSTNAVFYHQEFDLNIFKPQYKKSTRQITNFVNCLTQTAWFPQYYEMKVMLPEYEFKSYGGSNDNGVIETTQQIANIMNESYFGFHCKKYGDGFGFTIHEWMACGKPIITHISDYKDKLGGLLLEDGVTCIDLDQHTVEETCEIIRNMSEKKYDFMCQSCYQRFGNVVNYSREELDIKDFLGKLQ